MCREMSQKTPKPPDTSASEPTRNGSPAHGSIASSRPAPSPARASMRDRPERWRMISDSRIAVVTPAKIEAIAICSSEAPAAGESEAAARMAEVIVGAMYTTVRTAVYIHCPHMAERMNAQERRDQLLDVLSQVVLAEGYGAV